LEVRASRTVRCGCTGWRTRGAVRPGDQAPHGPGTIPAGPGSRLRHLRVCRKDRAFLSTFTDSGITVQSPLSAQRGRRSSLHTAPAGGAVAGRTRGPGPLPRQLQGALPSTPARCASPAGMGEQCSLLRRVLVVQKLSRRTQGADLEQRLLLGALRTIPGQTGNSGAGRSRRTGRWDHPRSRRRATASPFPVSRTRHLRGRGEKPKPAFSICLTAGPARQSRDVLRWHVLDGGDDAVGTTPAHTGSTSPEPTPP
jgi:hypothetical protein